MSASDDVGQGRPAVAHTRAWAGGVPRAVFRPGVPFRVVPPFAAVAGAFELERRSQDTGVAPRRVSGLVLRGVVHGCVRPGASGDSAANGFDHVRHPRDGRRDARGIRWEGRGVRGGIQCGTDRSRGFGSVSVAWPRGAAQRGKAAVLVQLGSLPWIAGAFVDS
jgi:hypothetical protein